MPKLCVSLDSCLVDLEFATKSLLEPLALVTSSVLLENFPADPNATTFQQARNVFQEMSSANTERKFVGVAAIDRRSEKHAH
jgi:hypothetical protein